MSPREYLCVKPKHLGFTLIELLVVVSIIGLLASVVIATLNSAQARGRDARLIAEIKSFQNALALYYQDHGYYPPHTPDAGEFAGFQRYTALRGDNTDSVLRNALEPYMKKLPDLGSITTRGKWGNVLMSRASYRRLTNTNPNSSWSVPNYFGIHCPSGGRCYALQIYTETETPLGPAEQAIYVFENGETFTGWQWLVY